MFQKLRYVMEFQFLQFLLTCHLFASLMVKRCLFRRSSNTSSAFLAVGLISISRPDSLFRPVNSIAEQRENGFDDKTNVVNTVVIG